MQAKLSLLRFFAFFARKSITFRIINLIYTTKIKSSSAVLHAAEALSAFDYTRSPESGQSLFLRRAQKKAFPVE
ncbi:hypothetical protein [Allofournierella sp.]|uniref:hypothetical protein n=1 Tax=Allofournierella sp. TaxID=1940256 RepID=UPI0025C125B5|nr:hypothetical protein [Fournierella sp.]